MLFDNLLFRSALFGSAVALGLFSASSEAKRTYTVLHNFAGAPSDGAYSYGSVRFDDAGNLYGTTNQGGASDAGVIFKIATDGTETILHSFDGAAGGANPRGGVTIIQSTGDLYGTASSGGTSSNCGSGGCGVLYRLSADGEFTMLHNFDGSSDGSFPVGRMIRDRLGNFYGAAAYSGSNGDGTIFRYGADGSFTVLHSFAGTDGAFPQGSLIRDRAGDLYGVTQSGGADNNGSVYKLAPDGALTTLYSFTGGNDGFLPVGGMDRDKAGNLYGTTELGGSGSSGTVFKLAPGGTLTTLHTFIDADGGYPEGDILHIGDNLYGTTEGGGDANCHCGVVFKLAPDGSETILHAFLGGDGGAPYTGLARNGHKLYGATGYYGTHSDGVVFSVQK
jgi:uncharacterized repeat protein (TIGR03803 family)